ELRGVFLQGSNDDEIYLYTTDAVYRYAVSEKVFYKLFDWTDVGLIGSQIAFAWKGSGDDLYAVTWAGMGGRECYRLIPKMTAQLPKKEELTIAILSSNSDGKLQKFVTQFNKSQSEIHAVIKTYASNPGGDLDAVMTRMQADFLGSDPPDIICLANLNSNEALVKQGYLLDLRPFLAQSEVLSEDDFYPEVLDAYTQNGTLYSIPYTFQLRSLVIPAKEAKGKSGWTYPEMIEYLREKEEYKPFRMFYFMQYYAFNDDLGYFYDEEKGTNSFDSEEFRELLEYMKECKEKEAFMSQDRPFVLAQEEFFGLASFAGLKEDHGEEVRIMGYPTKDGTPLTAIEGMTELSILATSKHPDWAWKFMESYLSRNPREGEQIYNTYNMYSNQNWMQAMIDEELPLYGKDHIDILDEEGNVIGTHYSEHKINQACVDAFLETLSHVKSKAAGTKDVRTIIYEEAAPYFEGQKSLDQVVDAISNRVGLYLAEQR
ncbi:MAG: extracellular solute-binding protein, partial [Lachnospiraceae bacterium]|nr:extracellular solute-binding protein [Lachnospiraceae bacterium]